MQTDHGPAVPAPPPFVPGAPVGLVVQFNRQTKQVHLNFPAGVPVGGGLMLDPDGARKLSVMLFTLAEQLDPTLPPEETKTPAWGEGTPGEPTKPNTFQL